jgi:chemotaxis signal transduction protein
MVGAKQIFTANEKLDRVKENKSSKIIVSLEEKTMGGIISELVDDYIRKNKKEISRISEKSDLK